MRCPKQTSSKIGIGMADLLPEHPDFLWRNPRLKSSYDVVIVGAGGHGLATAYYLAKEHGITNVAVIDKGWLGGGNMAQQPPLSAQTTCSIGPRDSSTGPCKCGKALMRNWR